GFIVTRLNFPTMVATAAWLPLAFWLAHLVTEKGGLHRTLALGIVLAAQFLAGHVQLWYYTLWFIGGYVLFCTFTGPKGRIRAWTYVLGALILGVSLAAVQFLPTLEFALNSQRKGGTGWDFAMTYSLWPWKLLALLMPDFFGSPAQGNYWGYANYWEDCGYIGVLPLILALTAFYRLSRRTPAQFAPTGRFLALTVPVSLLLALGKNTPVYPFIFRYVPGFDLFQAPARFLYLYTFAMAILGGMGLDLLIWLPPSPALLRRLGAVAVGVLTAAVALRVLPLGIRSTFTPASFSFALLFAGSVFCLRLQTPHRRPLALLLTLADLLAFGAGFNPFVEPAFYHQPTDTAFLLSRMDGSPFRIYTFKPEEYHIKYERFFRFDTFGPEDVSFWMGLRESQIPQLNMIEGLDHAGVFDPLTVGRYKDLLDAVERAPLSQALRLLGMLNVRYLISARAIPGFEPAAQRAGYLIYENDYFLPRAYVVSAVQRVADAETALAMVTSTTFDPAREAVIQADRPLHPRMHSPPRYAIHRLQYLPNGVRIKIAVEGHSYLVLSQTWYPGWQAYVDGKPTPLLRANYTLTAVELIPGVHDVFLCYSPLSFK
ncbi:MAG TPA: hypothetical protein EYP54_05705, partial [Anaerolineales bacterium]|nr:hypothetical protein [Anaerolineales bacterium]